MENNTDSHWMGNPTLSKLQEIISDLYDENLIIFAQKLEDVANGKINRLIVNMPPRHTKSE